VRLLRRRPEAPVRFPRRRPEAPVRLPRRRPEAPVRFPHPSARTRRGPGATHRRGDAHRVGHRPGRAVSRRRDPGPLPGQRGRPRQEARRSSTRFPRPAEAGRPMPAVRGRRHRRGRRVRRDTEASVRTRAPFTPPMLEPPIVGVSGRPVELFPAGDGKSLFGAERPKAAARACCDEAMSRRVSRPVSAAQGVGDLRVPPDTSRGVGTFVPSMPCASSPDQPSQVSRSSRS
jgi:hypothetical protein